MPKYAKGQWSQMLTDLTVRLSCATSTSPWPGPGPSTHSASRPWPVIGQPKHNKLPIARPSRPSRPLRPSRPKPNHKGTTHVLHTSHCSQMHSEMLWNVLVNLWGLTTFTRCGFCIRNHSQTLATICHRLCWEPCCCVAGERCTVALQSWSKFLKCVKCNALMVSDVIACVPVWLHVLSGIRSNTQQSLSHGLSEVTLSSWQAQHFGSIVFWPIVVELQKE